MGILGGVLLLAGAVIIGRTIDRIIARPAVRRGLRYQMIATIVGALLGGFVASEYVGQLGAWGYEYDGLFVFSAAIGAVIVGVIVGAVTHVFELRAPSHS